MAETHDTIDGLLAEFREHSAGIPPGCYVTMSCHDFRQMLNHFEAAHKREVGNRAAMREAHWVGIKYDSACCSKCGAYISTGFDTTSQAKDGWGDLYPYCPYCGAQMDLTVPFEGRSRNKKNEVKHGGITMTEETISKVLTGETDIAKMSRDDFVELLKCLGRMYFSRVMNCVDGTAKYDKEWTALSSIFNRVAESVDEKPSGNSAALREALQKAEESAAEIMERVRHKDGLAFNTANYIASIAKDALAATEQEGGAK